MLKPDIEKKVIAIISEQMGLPEDEVTREKSIGVDLGMDSIDEVELIIELENEFRLCINDEDAKKATTVGAIIDGLDRMTNAGA